MRGKAIARARLVERAAPRDGPHIQARVALTDGAEALQQQWLARFPEHTWVLDIIHATEVLWDTAHALLGDTHPHRTAWVRSDLEPLVAGPTAAVLTALEAEALDPTCTATQRHAVRRTVGYDRRNRPYMHDDAYLAQGWPIGTGVIEGACRHLGKDRMEPSGMRWTTAGAQAVLDLHAVRLNGQWEAYGPFHRPQHHRRWYGTSAHAPERAEVQALTLAASSHGYPRTLVTLKSFWQFEAAEVPVEVRNHGTRVDFVLRYTAKPIFLVAECKRADPALKDWCFARAPYMHRGRTDEPYTADAVMLRDRYSVQSAPVFLDNIREAYHIGLEVKGHQPGDGTGVGRAAIEDTLTQVFRGSNGMVGFFSQNPVCLHEGDVTVIVPVIFTTAQLWVSSADLSSASLITGAIDPATANLEHRDWVFYQYPISPGLKHTIAQVNNTAASIAGALAMNSIRTVPIVNSSAVEQFLASFDFDLNRLKYGPLLDPGRL